MHVRFQQKSSLNEFLRLCFGLSSAPKSNNKTYKSTNFSIEKNLYENHNLLRRYAFVVNIKREIFNSRDTLIYLLQILEFLINIQKSIMNPTSILGFLGVLVNSEDMTLSLQTEKVRKMQKQCREILSQQLVLVRTLNKLICRLASSALAILPASLQYRKLQHQKIQVIHSKNQEIRKWFQSPRKPGLSLVSQNCHYSRISVRMMNMKAD